VRCAIWSWPRCRGHFRPEFLNRLDEIILFHRLKREHMAAIVDIQIERLQRLLADRKITIRLDEAARRWLAERGYDPAYGARPLKRVIQKNLQDNLAEEILAGRIGDGDTVEVSANEAGLLINGTAAARAEAA
jgi:ATP-dependent Clp protease ATP-binding subunit ClpB